MVLLLPVSWIFLITYLFLLIGFRFEVSHLLFEWAILDRLLTFAIFETTQCLCQDIRLF